MVSSLEFVFAFAVVLCRGLFVVITASFEVILNNVAPPADLVLASTSPLRTMCGSRTGGWSLPGVMSD
jgi:hypothetical protein